MLREFFRRYGWRYLPGIGFLLLSAYLQNLTPMYLGEVTDALGEDVVDSGLIFRLLGLMLLAAALVFVTRYIWRYFINGNARNLEAHARETLFTHLQRMGVHFYAYRKTGDLMAYAINDINAIRMTLGPALAMTVNSISLASMAIVNMTTGVHPRLALLVLIPTPVAILVLIFMGREVRVRFRRVQEAFATISDRVQENISGLRVIKAYVQESAETARFEELNRASRDTNMHMVRVSATMSPLVDLLFGISFTISLLYGSSLVRDGVITLGEFVEFNGYLTLIMQPIRSISRIINVLSRGIASLRRYNAIMDVPPMIQEIPDALPEGVTSGAIDHAEIEVRGLTFRYPEDKRYALQDVSFHLRAGRTLGILGRTGSGKTTLVNLLVRLYNVPDGTVFVGGEDANQLSLSHLREPIGYVPQDNFLFSASIEDNIRFFSTAHTHEEVVEAAREAAILENIEDFPAGFATEVGERGMSLSGGQKQRLCIARALIKKPALLILDDSLSAVDTRTEAEILQRIAAQTERGGSAILIAHRISALAGCDEILVLDHGRVIERGTHQALMEADGAYATVAKDQMKADEEQEVGA